MIIKVSKNTNKKSIKQKVMKINTQNRRHIIQSTTAGLAAQFVVPVAGAHRATSLTIRTGNRSVALNGRQVRALRDVLAKSTELVRGTSKTRSSKS